MKTILSPEQIEEIQILKNETPIADTASKFHIGYDRIYQIWRQIKPDSIRPKITEKQQEEKAQQEDKTRQEILQMRKKMHELTSASVKLNIENAQLRDSLSLIKEKYELVRQIEEFESSIKELKQRRT